MIYQPRRRDLVGNWSALINTCSYMSLSDEKSYVHMLTALREDYTDADGVTTLGFYRAPAASNNHHAFEGGLVFHFLEMWWIWNKMRDHILPMALLQEGTEKEFRDHLDDGRMLKAIINHDLHKAWRTYRLVSIEPWRADYDQGTSDKLMTNDTKSLYLLSQAGIKLDEEQMNMLIQAEGGYSAIKPKWTSVAAKIAYLLDELSGNVLGRISEGRWLGHNEVVRPSTQEVAVKQPTAENSQPAEL